MYDVIEAIDGPICLNTCLVSGKSCERSTWCPAHPVWARAQRAMLDILQQASIEELAGLAKRPEDPQPSELKVLLVVH